MNDQDRVFDVARPNRVGALPTSKPVITPSHPAVNDPMVKEDLTSFNATGFNPSVPADKSITSVPVMDANEPPSPSSLASASTAPPAEPSFTVTDSNQLNKDLTNSTPATNALPDAPKPEPFTMNSMSSNTASAVESMSSLAGNTDNFVNSSADHPSYSPMPGSSDGAGVISPMPLPTPAGAGPKRRWKSRLITFFMILIVIALGAYLAIDAGLIKTNFKLPYDLFKEKEAAVAVVTTQTPKAEPKQTPPIVPEGFTEFKLPDTNLSFAYPNEWGTPTAVKDPGFTKRDGKTASDGTYAHLVNFATNKDVQIAFTSSKYLPATRAALYYDFLQWCQGTNDKKIYKQVLTFTTADKIDTPGTITCNQGPLTDATVDQTDKDLVTQLKTKEADGKTELGDLYTKNLRSTDLPVVRVKDSVMKNGDLIKKLLNTVYSSATITP